MTARVVEAHLARLLFEPPTSAARDAFAIGELAATPGLPLPIHTALTRLALWQARGLYILADYELWDAFLACFPVEEGGLDAAYDVLCNVLAADEMQPLGPPITEVRAFLVERSVQRHDDGLRRCLWQLTGAI